MARMQSIKVAMQFSLVVVMFIFISQTKAQGSQGSNLAKQIEDIYKSCGDKKSNCVGVPVDCAQQNNCRYMVSISPKLEYSDMYKFTMLGVFDNQQNPNEGNYVAVGIAKDGRLMANTSIVSCSTGKIDVFWANTKTTPEYVGIGYGARYVVAGQNSPVDGKIFCQFDVSAKFSEHGHNFDLDSEKYAILLAQGPLKPDRYGTPNYHRENRYRYPPMYLSHSSASSISSPFLLFLVSVIIAFVQFCK